MLPHHLHVMLELMFPHHLHVTSFIFCCTEAASQHVMFTFADDHDVIYFLTHTLHEPGTDTVKVRVHSCSPEGRVQMPEQYGMLHTHCYNSLKAFCKCTSLPLSVAATIDLFPRER